MKQRVLFIIYSFLSSRQRTHYTVKYPHCTPITPSRGTKDAATVRAIGVPNILQKAVPTATRGGGGWEGRNLNATFTELRRTGQGAAKTALFEERAATPHARQQGDPAGRS